jgi:NAD(P)-dependent dehydrogenase (short-subunit alcohol dehydrogenase family)
LLCSFFISECNYNQLQLSLQGTIGQRLSA